MYQMLKVVLAYVDSAAANKNIGKEYKDALVELSKALKKVMRFH